MAGTKVTLDNGKSIQQAKIGAVAALSKEFSNYNDVIFANYRGLKFGQMSELRSQLREQKAVFKVIKNRTAKIAFEEMKRPDVSAHLVGPTAVALTTEDAAAVAKILFNFAREYPLEIKGGLIDGDVFSHDQVEAFSRLPGRDDLLAMLMGTMNAPLQNLVYGLNGVTQKLVRTLQAVADAKSA